MAWANKGTLPFYCSLSSSSILPSIHCSACLLISSALLPWVWIVGPMTTRMVPGFFKKPRFGQNEPALWATGTTGQPDPHSEGAD